MNKIWILFALAGMVFATMTYAEDSMYYGWKAPEEYKDLKNPQQGSKQSLDQGKKVYDLHCAKCHGAKGEGVGTSTDSLKTLPGDLSDKQRMDLYTDGALYWKIYVGRGEMPPWQLILSEEEIWDAVNFIRTFTLK